MLKIMNGADVQNQRIVNVADPSSATDAANRQYVDNVARGLSWHEPVRAATTTDGALATAYEDGDSVDGVTLATGDRILLTSQAASVENGIYVVQPAGAPVRAADAATGEALAAGTAVTVTEGTTRGDQVWMITSDSPVVVGTDSSTWGPLGGGGTTYSAGAGLALSGTTFAVAAGSGIIADGTSTRIDPSVVARKYAANIGDGSSTSIAVAHNLGTRDVVVSVHDSATFDEVVPDVAKTDANTVTVSFASAPAANAYRVTVIG